MHRTYPFWIWSRKLQLCSSLGVYRFFWPLYRWKNGCYVITWYRCRYFLILRTLFPLSYVFIKAFVLKLSYFSFHSMDKLSHRRTFYVLPRHLWGTQMHTCNQRQVCRVVWHLHEYLPYCLHVYATKNCPSLSRSRPTHWRVRFYLSRRS